MFKDLILKTYKATSSLITRKILIECDRIPYQFHNVPLKKILNWIRVEASILRKPEQPWGWPTHLQLEPTNTCNLRCALCPVTEGMNRPRGSMDFSLFKKLIDEIGDYLFLILLWDWGEPFNNPCVYDMISYTKQKGIKIVSSTNGHLFAQVEHADKVIQSGLDTLIVAMDGMSQETYEPYREKGKLETMLKGIQTIVARKRALNSKGPLINLRFIAMKHNEHEIPNLKDFAKSLGVDALTIKTLNPHANDSYSLKRSVTDEEDNKFLPSDYSYRRFKYAPDGKTYIRVKNNPCKNLWNDPTIHWNGVVCPCTYDYDEKYVFGDLKLDTFRDIWFGAAYCKMRRQFHRDWKKLNFCCECSFAYKGGNCINEIIVDANFFNQGHPA